MSKHKMIEGPFGFPMKEKTALELEEILSTLPASQRTIRRKTAISDSLEIEDEDRTDISLVTTESVDGDGEVVKAAGIDVEQYQRNPIVLWSHNHNELPIGRCVWIKKISNGLRAKTEYGNTDLANDVFDLIKAGFLKAKSIGFLPLKMRSPYQEELETNTKWTKDVTVIESSLLLEYSCVNIGCNPDALVESHGKSLNLSLLGIEKPTIVKPTVIRPKPPKRKKAAIAFDKLFDLKFDPQKIAQQAIDNLSKRTHI